LSQRGSVVFDIDEKLAKRINLEEFAREIDLKCWDRLAKLSWRPFEEARAFVHGLGFNLQVEWFNFCKGLMPEKGNLPADIPATPSQIYKNYGWSGYGDWLGTGRVADQLRKFRSFQNARFFARELNLTSRSEWDKYCRGQLLEKGLLPDDIPCNPHQTYSEVGWRGMGDWLGTNRICNRLRNYRPFGKARTFVRALNLKSQHEWIKFCKGCMPEKGSLPQDIPSNPNKAFKKTGWKGYGDWLGTGTIAPHLRKFRSFIQARKFVRSLNLTSQNEWRHYLKGKLRNKPKLPSDIPKAPDLVYKKLGWIDFGDWIGTGNISTKSRKYQTFIKARAFTQLLNLKSRNEWHQFCKGQIPEKGALPPDIPTNPHRNYKNLGWKGYADWLGKNKPLKRHF
jgi:hypothetical protein